MTEIIQDGTMVELHGSAPNGAAYQGRGSIQGAYAVIDFANSLGVQGRLVLQLVQNGAYIQGQMQTMMGAMPFTMMRRG